MSSLPVCPDGSFEALDQAGIRYGIVDNKIVVPVPFLGEDGGAHRGYLVDPLHLMGDGSVGVPSDHQMYFAGGIPHEISGENMLNVLGEISGSNYPVFSGMLADYHFSHKKITNGQMRDYTSLAEKVIQYFRTISSPAEHKYPGTIAAMVGVDFDSNYDPPFKFPDSHSAAAGLQEVNKLICDLSIAVIGVGGTGSYILDYLVKTPVKKITIYDDDIFELKNSYRSPGTSSAEEFDRPKVDVYRDRYSKFREGLEFRCLRINSSNIDCIDESDFIFLALDSGVARQEISKLLDLKGASYIDVGMGLERADDGLFGMIRTTFVCDENREIVARGNTIPFADAQQEQYLTNIQIAEWNALNAAIAVIRFKSHYGFYADDVNFFMHLMPTRRMSAIVKAEPS